MTHEQLNQGNFLTTDISRLQKKIGDIKKLIKEITFDDDGYFNPNNDFQIRSSKNVCDVDKNNLENFLKDELSAREKELKEKELEFKEL